MCIEVQLFPMFRLPDGDLTLASEGERPVHYDILVTRLIEETGEIEVLVEKAGIEDLETATKIYEQLCEEYLNG